MINGSVLRGARSDSVDGLEEECGLESSFIKSVVLLFNAFAFLVTTYRTYITKHDLPLQECNKAAVADEWLPILTAAFPKLMSFTFNAITISINMLLVLEIARA